MKKNRAILFLVLVVFTLSFFSGTAAGEWVLNDEGEKYWWEPPNTPIQSISEDPGVRTQTDAEVLFLMDTSGSMGDEFTMLCGKIEDIVQGLKDKGINLEYKILGITGNWYCTTGTVSGSVENPTVNHSEDWGPAVEDVANQYPWKADHVRIAIPMSDEGAENGDSWTSADDDAIDRAKEAAKNNSVGVIPVVCSGYSQDQLDGATELADYCWGSVFKSTSDTQAFVDGITNAINQIFNPVSDKLDVDIFVDDAFTSESTGNIIKVRKIAGDIAFLVVEIKNGDSEGHNVDIEITYPSNWVLVDHNPVMKREELVSDEKALDTETVDTGTNGTVQIKNVEVPKQSGHLWWKNDGKSWQYLVKVLIPTDQAIGSQHAVKAKISSASVSSNSILTSEDLFFVKVIEGADMILTNRNLLIKKHGNNEKIVDNILLEIQKVASSRGAVVFYVDWWDEYDNFAKDKNGNLINPSGTGSDSASTPIKNWDRATDIDYSSEEKANEKVCKHIDNYTHYWAEQLGGLNNERYLLIVGGDEIIPFFRMGGIPHGWFYDTDKSHNQPWFTPADTYNSSAYTEKAADADLAYSDVIYADTDELGYQNGEVEEILPGRLVGQDADNLLKNLKNSALGRSARDNVIISAYKSGTQGEDDRFPIAGTQVAIDAIASGYQVNKETNDNSLYTDETVKWIFEDDLKPEFSHTFDHFIYRGHGNKDGSCDNSSDETFFGGVFDGKIEINGPNKKISELFEETKPNFMMIACLNGLVDRDSEESANSDLMVYSLVRNNVRDMIGATTVSNGDANNEFIRLYFKYVTGFDFEESPAGAKTLGMSLKLTRDRIHGDTDMTAKPNWRACSPIYVLYGTPWHTYNAPDDLKDTANTVLKETGGGRSFAVSGITEVVTIQNTTSKIIQERIFQYELASQYGFDFIKIDDYAKLEKGEDTPVLPVKRFYITLPREAVINNVNVSANNSINLGELNIPVTNDEPPYPGHSSPTYIEAPKSIALFNSLYRYGTYTTQDNQVLVLSLFPVSYNTVTDEAILYRDIDIEITYDTSMRGVLLESGPKKQAYSSGETINVPISVENIIDQTANFEATVGLKDSLGNVLQTKTTTVSVDPATITQTTVQLEAPATGGSYWVSTSVSDGTYVIGTSNEHINVNPGAITNFEIPRCVPGSTAQFSVTFINQSTSQIEATFGLHIYDGSLKTAEFIPRVYNVPSGAEQTANFNWNIPSDFPSGDFLAMAFVSSNGYATSASEAFGIGTLGEGWNLISLHQQPANTTITKVLEHILDKVESVWALINGSWYIYDPDNPGFSDLTEMTAGYGYWINLNTAFNLSVSGSIPGKTINLISGWNLVGYNSQTEQPVADALATIVGKVESVWTQINGEWKVYFPANSGMSDLATMAPGYGYYIKTTGACTWTLP